MNNANATLGVAVRRRRRDLGLSLASVAKRMGISAAALSLLERGESTWSMPRIVTAANALEVQPSELVSAVSDAAA